ncbi:long-chain fatty acid--CoA ligase [Tersicoccus phoenicis]|uniref:Long-chain fatty acid--CoA ligase n=1 Tax=Tersicoccus phoenicis TaxID=554083 RepID=A0A1R1L9M7_9MICC|nr:AMP-dependent synthetase/ligase [Tersicoccus phoenicis]OMH24252.1 long-chain fatty acid--CoA ligase [Tersicoccus phoenicis]
MREAVVPALVEVDPDLNITDLLLRQTAKPHDPALFARRGAADAWQDVPATLFLAEVTAVARGLIASGIQPGDRIGIMASTSYQWSLVDFAIWFAGAVSVPVYETSAPSQVAWNLTDSGARAIFVESDRHRAVVDRARELEDLVAVGDVWVMDDAGLAPLIAAGRDVPAATVEDRRSAAGLEDPATVIYTSGTTGRPKGVILTHGNFVRLADNASAALGSVAHEGARTIMFLPLAHVFARFIAVLAVSAGCVVAHTPDVKNLLRDLQGFRPDFILVVPRVFEKVYNASKLKAEDGGRGTIFAAAERVAIDWSRARQAGSVPVGLRLRHALFDRLVYGKLRTAMGGRVRFAVSGGGPLGERLGHFFDGVGVTVLEGYGLTETTAPLTVNTPEKIKIGTVGPALPGNGIRIAEDGEVLAAGVCVTPGYWRRDDLNAEAFSDGWFHTGDLGELDEDGYLRITGRKKEILVTSGGKNVAPSGLEDAIRADSLVSQCIVVGDHRPFISALVTLDEEALPGWLKRHQLPAMSAADAAGNDVVVARVQELVDAANERVSRAESIRAFRVVPTDFTEASGHLTPSLKLRRARVIADFTDLIDEIYAAQRR